MAEEQRFERALVLHVSNRDGSYCYMGVYGTNSKLLSRPLRPESTVLVTAYEDMSRSELRTVLHSMYEADRAKGLNVHSGSPKQRRKRTRSLS